MTKFMLIVLRVDGVVGARLLLLAHVERGSCVSQVVLNCPRCRVRGAYAVALGKAGGATLEDLCEAVTTQEDTTRTAVRVLGAAHPTTRAIEYDLRCARAVLNACQE